MATRAQLEEHGQKKQEFEARVADVERTRAQALPRAEAQLAVIATDRAFRGEPTDISEREGFDPANPADVLTPDEALNLADSKLVVDSLKSYIDTTFRLQNKVAPRVYGNMVSSGRI